MLEQKLNSLKAELVSFASLVENMLAKGVNGLLNSDRSILEEVIYKDEPRANRYELELDNRCATLIAQFQPKAKDMRTILMILQMNNDLERLGDLAVNICESAFYLVDRPDVPRAHELLATIKDEALGMFQDSINAFVNEDTELSRKVCDRDSVVDDLRDTILREMITYMKSNTDAIEECVHIIRISRNIERFADLSTNLCEDVMYMVEGTVIKHHDNGN